ncbi:hypothetical protein SELMODRAFT_409440 [Selaginella moellendorffii]|uniref:ATPase domain-containing protein n=1 Tax=Selaginella moellendorffii TaxID=88036 RepID=D8RBG6_SELML|nr:hypothetical protein SELMODRAFT_409440 [Selaginella moellendorffii]
MSLKEAFFNRSSELAALHKALALHRREGDTAVLATILGPKSSGKTMLMREYCRRQREGMYPGTSTYVNLRDSGLTDPGRLATKLMGGFLKSLSVFQMRVGFGSDLTGKWALQVGLKDGVDLETPFGFGKFQLFGKPEPKGIDAVLAALKECCLSWTRIALKGGHTNAFPTIFIDEANALMSWAETPDGMANLNMLLRCLVAICKEERSSNVVLGSSENFFERWLAKCGALAGHRVARWYVGHLSEPLAKAYFMLRVGEAKQAEVEPLWDAVYRLYGGQMLELNLLASAIESSEPGEAAEVFEGEAGLSITTAVANVVSGWSPGKFRSIEGRGNGLWKPEDWSEVIKVCANAPEGVVSKCELKLPSDHVDSMIEHNCLHVQPVISWTERGNPEDDTWPLVMPMTKAEHLAMKRLVRKYSL